MGPKPVFGYWKIRGVGQPIRFLMKYLGMEFESKLYEFSSDPDPAKLKEHWIAERMKLGLPLPNLPYLIDGDVKVNESRAILRYLCRTRRPELLGKTLDIQTKVDMVDFFMLDIMEFGLVPVVYEYTEERHKFLKEEVEPLKLGFLTDFLGDNKWITGNDLTFVDFFTYEVLYHLCVYDPKCLDKFPKLKAYMGRFEEIPAIKDYMNSPDYIKGPCYLPIAAVKI